MRHIKILGVALVTIFVLGMTATSALALPDISLLPKEAFPLDLHFADNSKTPTALEDSFGDLLTGKGIEIALELTALGALGSFTVDALNVKDVEIVEECHTSGNEAGTVLVTGEWHLVPITTTPLLNGIAFLLKNLVLMTCGIDKIDVKGCALAKTTATETKDLTGVPIELGSNGKGQALQREYLNDVPVNVKCILEDEIVGTKKPLEAALVVAEGKAIELVPIAGKAEMFFITGL